MRKIFIIFITSLLSISAYTQTDSSQIEQRFEAVEKQIKQLQTELNTVNKSFENLRSKNNLLRKNITGLTTRENELSAQIDSLNTFLSENQNSIDKLNSRLSSQKNELNAQVSETRENTSEKISTLSRSLSRNTLYWIIAVLTVGLLSLIAFIFLKRKVSANETSITEKLAKTRKELEEEAIKLDEKLVGILENQLKILQEERPEEQNGQDVQEQDHSLALKVADEIFRIEKNLERIDDKQRIKPLSKALESIKLNLKKKGYEITSLLNKTYDDRDEINVRYFKVDENLNDGERIITRVIKPQVKFNGVLIQKGQVDVSLSD
ncbi:MAG: hypothetical protein ACOCWW_04050 [Bacteroidota bacterium]